MNKLLVVSMVMACCAVASARVSVEESGSKAIFKVSGKAVSPVDAQGAAVGDAPIERCTPIKDAMTSDGNPAYRCKRVQLTINPKTGTTKWKNL